MKLLNIDAWERTRNAGRKRFVLRYGVAISVAFAFSLAVFVYWRMAESGLFAQMPGFRAGTIRFWILAVVVGAPLFGYIWGLLSWHLMELVYRRIQKKAAGA